MSPEWKPTSGNVDNNWKADLVRPDIRGGEHFEQVVYQVSQSMGRVLVVLTITGAVDWAAYIGPYSANGSVEEAQESVSHYGRKLPELIARAFCPDIHPDLFYRD